MIVSSSASSDSTAQADGRFWVTETQTLDDGSAEIFVYLADKGTDTKAVMTQRAAAINAAIASAPPPDPVFNAIINAQNQYTSGNKVAAKQSLDFASAQLATAISAAPII